MTKRPRRTQSPGFRAKVAAAALKGGETLAEPARPFDVPPHQITAWKTRLPRVRLAIMHRIAALHLEHPVAGSRMLRDMLRAEGLMTRSNRICCATCWWTARPAAG